MAAIMIRCPRTGQAVSTEIETEPSVLARLPNVEGRMRCPSCGEEHVWTVGDAWLDEPAPAMGPVAGCDTARSD